MIHKRGGLHTLCAHLSSRCIGAGTLEYLTEAQAYAGNDYTARTLAQVKLVGCRHTRHVVTDSNIGQKDVFVSSRCRRRRKIPSRFCTCAHGLEAMKDVGLHELLRYRSVSLLHTAIRQFSVPW